MAKIGFIIPIYKLEEDLLKVCINSVLSQTYTDIHLVLVDDGSPDNCGQICDDYADMDHRITVVHQENQGVSTARNAGLNIVEAEWVVFVDGDDWIEPDTCEKLINLADADCDILIYSGYRDYAGITRRNESLIAEGTVFDNPEMIRQLTVGLIDMTLSASELALGTACCKMYRTEWLSKNTIRFQDSIPVNEDMLFVFEAFLHASRIKYVDCALYHYRDTPGSAVNNYRPNADVEQDLFLGELLRLINCTETPDIYREGYYIRAFFCMQMCITQKFFNSRNPAAFLTRHLECSTHFKKEPYHSALKKTPFFKLTRNNKLKAVLIWLRCYSMVAWLRKLYFEKIR